MINIRKFLMDDFKIKTFLEKKEILLGMLKELSGYSKKTDELLKMVETLPDLDESSEVFNEVCELLLNAIDSVESENFENSVKNLKKVNLVLKSFREKEKEEMENEDIESFIDLKLSKF